MKRLSAFDKSMVVIGDRWNLKIVRQALNGVEHFDDMLDKLGIARNILSARFKVLVEAKVLKRTECKVDCRKVSYTLTPKGEKLSKVIAECGVWGRIK